MSDLNLKATEFIPSWLKAKPTTATAATTTTPSASTTSNNTSNKHHAPSSNGAPPAAPKPSQQQPSQAVQSPAQIPWKAPPPPATSNPSLAAAAAASAGVAARSHMNPHAVVFEPKFLTQQQTPTLKAQQPPPPTTQMTRPQSTSAGGTGRPAGVTIQVVPPQWPAPQKSNTSPKPAPLPPSPARGSAAAQPSPPLPSAKRVSHLLPPSSQPLTKTATSAATVAPKKTTPPQIVKTDAEILAISERSNLKVGAAVFVPGQRSGSSLHAKNILMGKPSPLTLTPASPDTEMLLFDAWCLYCLCNSVTKEENYDPTLVFRIDSVPTFWKTMNNLPEPTGFAPPTTMYLFRDDIYPKWEDPKNVSGGVWKIRVDRDTIDDVWLVLACKTIGESWLKEHRNTINGIVLKVREKGFYIEVWVTERRDQFPGDLQGALSELLPAFMIDFYTHHQIQEAMKEHAAAPKGKNANKKGAKRK